MTESQEPTTRVLLVHGIWNAKSWLTPLARRLRREGFDVEVFGYPSILGGPEPAIAALIERLRSSPPLHLVGHSLGGLIGLEALRRAPDHAEITYRADNDIRVEGDTALQVKKLLDMLEDLDDVQNVYSNAELGADVYA